MDYERRNPRAMDFDQACAASSHLIESLRRKLAGLENLSERELDRRVSLYHIERERLEKRLAACWRKILIDVGT